MQVKLNQYKKNKTNNHQKGLTVIFIRGHTTLGAAGAPTSHDYPEVPVYRCLQRHLTYGRQR